MNNYFKYDQKTTIYYETHGNGPVPVLFLHGFACSHLNWYLIKDKFDNEKYTLYLIDLKGYGNSSKPHDKKYSIKDQAEIIIRFIEQMKLFDIILVGHSYGGSVALVAQVLIKQPLIKKLILIAVPCYIDYIPRFMRILRTPVINRLSMLLIYLLPNAIKRALERIYFDPSKVSAEIKSFYTPYYKKPFMQHTYIQTTRRAIPGDYREIIAQYPAISIPVLFIWASHDRIVSKHNGYRLQKEIPRLQLQIINNCGHNTMEECPVETSRLILNFVEETV